MLTRQLRALDPAFMLCIDYAQLPKLPATFEEFLLPAHPHEAPFPAGSEIGPCPAPNSPGSPWTIRSAVSHFPTLLAFFHVA